MPTRQALALGKRWQISSLLKNEGLTRRAVRDCDFDVLNLIATLADDGLEPEAFKIDGLGGIGVGSGNKNKYVVLTACKELALQAQLRV